MTIRELYVLAAIDDRHLRALLVRLLADARRGLPWSRSLACRVLVTCAALRTNLTLRELAIVVGLSRSTLHRVIADITRRLAHLPRDPPLDRRWTWVVDGSLIPTRDHQVAAKSKNYRYSCNAQVLIRRADRRVIAIATAALAIETTSFTTKARRSRPFARNTIACLPTVDIGAFASS